MPRRKTTQSEPSAPSLAKSVLDFYTNSDLVVVETIHELAVGILKARQKQAELGTKVAEDNPARPHATNAGRRAGLNPARRLPRVSAGLSQSAQRSLTQDDAEDEERASQVGA